MQEIQVSEIDLGKPPPGATEELVGEVEPGDGMAAIVAGVVVLLVPRVLSYVVGIDLVVIGLLEAGVVRA